MKAVDLMTIALASLLAAGPSQAANELCTRMKVFEQQPLDKLPDGGLQRRWMDFSWEAPEEPASPNEIQIGATLKCHGSDDAAKSLCQYALRKSPHENVTALPMSILRCYKLAPNRPTFPRLWVEEVSWDLPNGLIERLQVDELGRPSSQPSIRLTVIPVPESPQAKKPVPFFKSLSDKLGLWDQGGG